MDAYIGEIRAFPFTFVPSGWLACNGQELYVVQYQALYAVLGNIWGGTPGSTFKVPNLQTLAVMGAGTGPGLTPRPWGATVVGSEQVALQSEAQLPPHTHELNTYRALQGVDLSTVALSAPVANDSYLATVRVNSTPPPPKAVRAYVPDIGQSPDAFLDLRTVGYAGGGPNGEALPHENRQPYLTLGFFICWEGVFPVPN